MIELVFELYQLVLCLCRSLLAIPVCSAAARVLHFVLLLVLKSACLVGALNTLA